MKPDPERLLAIMRRSELDRIYTRVDAVAGRLLSARVRVAAHQALLRFSNFSYRALGRRFAFRADRAALLMVTRIHTCAECGREFLLDRWNLPPGGVRSIGSAHPVCAACRPRWVTDAMRERGEL